MSRRIITESDLPKLTLVTNGDDWEGLYLNGQLYSQDHKVSLHDLAAALGFEIANVEVSADWLGDTVCQLPEKLTDIPKDSILS